MFQIKNIRRTIYIAVATLIVLVFAFNYARFGTISNRLYRELAADFGLLGVIFVYLALIIGPLTQFNMMAKWRMLLKKSRRAIGVCGFVLSFIHSFVGFFGLMLGGSFDLNNIAFIPGSYNIPLIVGAGCLAGLFLLAVTSTDLAMDKMGSKWYLLHRLIYVIGVGIVIHVFWIGSSFQTITSIKSILFLGAISLLVLLYALRLDYEVFKRFPHIQKAGIVTTIAILGLSLFFGFRILPSVYNSTDKTPAQSSSFSPIHLRHLKSLQDQGANVPQNPLTALENSKRYTVSFGVDGNPTPNIERLLSFRITNSDNGEQVRTFSNVYEKFAHIIILDENFGGFEHVHPQLIDGTFVLAKTFGQAGNYRIYINFTPRGDIENQFAFRLKVGETGEEKQSKQIVTSKMQEIGNGISVELDQSNLSAKDLTLGKGMMIYTIRQNGEMYKDVRPYLGAFGHLSMVKLENGDFVHVHPNLQTPPKPDDRSNGSIEFVPFGLVKNIEPGKYKLFGEFNIGGEIKVIENVIEIKE